MTRTMPWGPAEAAPPFTATLLHLFAAVLRSASDMLARHAVRVSERALSAQQVHTVEFHALHRDAGAPEGALYINGEFVGVIEGVSRL
jgi:hypothetical protein